MMMKRILTFLLLLFVLGAVEPTLAQSFTTRVSSSVIGKRDVLQVDYIADNVSIQQFTLPRLDTWKVVGGPNESMNSVQVGKMVKQRSIYSVILQPKLTGTLLVPGATALINNKPQRSSSVAVVVKNVDHIPGALKSQQAAPAPQVFDNILPQQVPTTQYLRRGEKATDKIRNNILIRVEASKRSCYVGEPIQVLYKLCTRLQSSSKVVRQPTFAGCTVIEQTQDEDQQQHVENINGKSYNVIVMRKVALIPLDAGKLVLPSTSVENTVPFYDASNMSERDLLLNPHVPVREISVTMQNTPAEVDVKPLPPFTGSATFSGAIGKFNIVPAAGDAFATNKTNNLLLSLQGTGNVLPVQPPALVLPKGTEGFEPLMKDESDKTTFPLRAKKVFTYPFVADRAGKYAVAPVQFTYFDPETGTYVTKATPSFAMNVVKESKPIIKTSLFSDNEAFQQRLFIVLGAAVLLILVGLLWYNAKHKLHSKTAAKPPQPEPAQQSYTPASNEHLFKIRNLQPENDVQFFYKLLHRYLEEFTKERLKIDPSQLQLYIIEHPFDAAPLQQLQTLLNHCSVGRYTPVYSLEEAMQHRLQAIEVVNRLT